MQHCALSPIRRHRPVRHTLFTIALLASLSACSGSSGGVGGGQQDSGGGGGTGDGGTGGGGSGSGGGDTGSGGGDTGSGGGDTGSGGGDTGSGGGDTGSGGGSGDSGGSGGDGGSIPAPTLNFGASPTSVAPGETVTLSWSAGDAKTCEASGGWSGTKAISGSETVGPLQQDTEFRLSCSGAGGGVSRQTTVTVTDGSSGEPVVTLRVDREQVAVNDSATLTWSAENASRCTATGAWSGDQPLSGTFGTGPLTETASYGLSCSGANGNALASVTVEVLDKTLRWQAPTQNVDGSPLDDLAGFIVYWGTESRQYSSSHRISSADATEWVAEVPAGSYYFALTAFDTEGNESAYSNEVEKTIL